MDHADRAFKETKYAREQQEMEGHTNAQKKDKVETTVDSRNTLGSYDIKRINAG